MVKHQSAGSISRFSLQETAAVSPKTLTEQCEGLHSQQSPPGSQALWLHTINDEYYREQARESSKRQQEKKEYNYYLPLKYNICSYTHQKSPIASV